MLKVELNRMIEAYLDDLAVLGILGSTREEVAVHLIRKGVEEALRDGFLRHPPPAPRKSHQ